MAANSSSTTAAVVDVAVTCCKAIMIMLVLVGFAVTLMTVVGLVYFASKLTQCDVSCDDGTPGAELEGEGVYICDGTIPRQLLISIKCVFGELQEQK